MRLKPLLPLLEGLYVQPVELLREKVRKGACPHGVLYLGEEVGKGADEHDVSGLGVPEGEGDLLAFDDIDFLLEILLEDCRYVAGVRCLPQVDGRGKYLLVVDDDARRVFAVVDVPERLQELEGEEEVDLAVFDEGR